MMDFLTIEMLVIFTENCHQLQQKQNIIRKILVEIVESQKINVKLSLRIFHEIFFQQFNLVIVMESILGSLFDIYFLVSDTFFVIEKKKPIRKWYKPLKNFLKNY